MTRCEVHTDLRPKLPDPPSHFDEAEPEGVELHPADPTFDELPPQSVHQPVGTSVQQEPELVGDEPMATEAIGFDVQLEVFYPVLAFPAPRVELVKVFRSLAPGAHHEAPIRTLLHRLRLVDHPAPFFPARRRIEVLAEEPLLRPFRCVKLHRLFEQFPAHLLESGVGDEGYGVGYALLFAVFVDLRDGEASIGPHLYPHFGPSAPQ